jgi:hypothetical protein
MLKLNTQRKEGVFAALPSIYFNSEITKNPKNMTELGLSDVLTIAQTVGIVGTMI